MTPPPSAPQQPLDESLVRRFVQLAGQAPERPSDYPYKPKNTYEAITGGITVALDELFGGGQLRRDRRKMLADYKKDLEEFHLRQQVLGLQGLQSAQRQSEETRGRKQFEADRMFDIARKEFAQQARYFQESQKEERKERLLQRQAEMKELAQKGLASRQATLKLMSEGASPTIAKELADYLSGLSTNPLSPEAEKWVGAGARLKELRLNKPSRSSRGTATDRKMEMALEAFNGLKRTLEEVVQRGDQMMVSQLRNRLRSMATSIASRFGDRVEVGETVPGWPYVKLRETQPQASGRPTPVEGQMYFDLSGDDEISPGELQEIARRKGISLEQAKAMAQSEGLRVKE